MSSVVGRSLVDLRVSFDVTRLVRHLAPIAGGAPTLWHVDGVGAAPLRSRARIAFEWSQQACPDEPGPGDRPLAIATTHLVGRNDGLPLPVVIGPEECLLLALAEARGGRSPPPAFAGE